MFYFWAAVCLVGAVFGGFRLDAVKHGAPYQITSQHCAVNQPPFTGVAGFACRATEQDYGWPFVVKRHVYGATSPTRGFVYPNDYYVFAPGRYRRHYTSPNMIVASAVFAAPFGLMWWRANRKLNQEYKSLRL